MGIHYKEKIRISKRVEELWLKTEDYINVFTFGGYAERFTFAIGFFANDPKRYKAYHRINLNGAKIPLKMWKKHQRVCANIKKMKRKIKL